MKAKENPPGSSANGLAAHATPDASTAPAAAIGPIPTGGALGNAVKLSVNVTRATGMRLRRIAFDERVSESSIVEIALDGLFADRTDAQLGTYLRENGASLRRPGRDER